MPSRELRPWDEMAIVPSSLAKGRWSKLGWMAFSKLVVAAAVAAGSKLGERAVDAIFGEDDRDEPDDEAGVQ